MSDEPIPKELKDDSELWSGCISGAFHELDLLRELESAGFHGLQIEIALAVPPARARVAVER